MKTHLIMSAFNEKSGRLRRYSIALTFARTRGIVVEDRLHARSLREATQLAHERYADWPTATVTVELLDELPILLRPQAG